MLVMNFNLIVKKILMQPFSDGALLQGGGIHGYKERGEVGAPYTCVYVMMEKLRITGIFG